MRKLTKTYLTKILPFKVYEILLYVFSQMSCLLITAKTTENKGYKDKSFKKKFNRMNHIICGIISTS